MFTQEQGSKSNLGTLPSIQFSGGEKQIIDKAAQADIWKFATYIRHIALQKAKQDLGISKTVTAS